MSLNEVFKPTRSQGGALLVVLMLILIYPAMLVGLAWIVTNSILSIVAAGVSFWPILGLIVVAWVMASWIGPKK